MVEPSAVGVEAAPTQHAGRTDGTTGEVVSSEKAGQVVSAEVDEPEGNIMRRWLDNEPHVTLFCVIVSAVALVLSLGGWTNPLLPFDIAWVAVVLCGIPIVVGAAVALFTEHDIKADMLVSMALIASVVTSEFFAAGEVAFIMQIGSLLEDYTAHRARKGVESLVELAPQMARVRRGGDDGDGASPEHVTAADATAGCGGSPDELIPVEDVRIGDIIVVLAGETVPVDGVITEGETTIDQSTMTGESMPVEKGVGDKVTSGTVNRFGPFEMRATQTCADSSLQRMIRLAREADERKAPIVGIADRWASWMVWIALACAVIVGLLTHDFMRAVTVLVVFCPCAFVLATPTAVAAAIGNLTRFGVLVRGGDALERLSTVDRVAFDKTGTLTFGEPRVAFVEAAEGYAEDEVLALAGAAEQRSEHPLGKAIVKECEERGIALGKARDYEVLPGQGIAASTDAGTVRVGKGTAGQAGEQRPDPTVTLVRVTLDGRRVGLIGLSDTVREESAEAVRSLEEMGIEPMLLTGDNGHTADAIGSAVGIGEVHHDLLPEDKMRIVEDAGKSGSKVCMVGDGINDALALGSAYAGVAMGGVGSDIAVESADAVLVSDDMGRLPYLFNMSRRAMTKVKQNIIIGMCINFVAIILSGLGLLTPVTGALVHNCGSVFVVVNAATLLPARK